MKRSTRCVLFGVAVWSVLSILATSVESADEPTPVAEKARKYHAILRKRPEPGYLFDRFYNTWLDDSTVDQLRTFLTDEAASGETSDRLLLAFFQAKQGDDTGALESYAKALADAPGSAAVLYHKAAAEARTLDFDAAIVDLEKARTLDPSDKLRPKIDKHLGKLLIRNRKTEEALQVWQELLAANPDDEDLQEDVLELHIEEGLYDDAARLAEQMIERTNDKYLEVTRRLRLGDIHYRAGSREKALDTYALALTEVGHDTWIEREILAQIEDLFRREDDLAGARKYYEELLEQHPKRIAIHQRRARLLVDLGEKDEAKAAHQEILRLTPGDRANREAFITMLARIEEHEEAIAQLRALIEQHSDDAELKFRLAVMLADADQTDDAVQAVRDYLAASERSEYAFLRAARQLERFERPEAAGKVYEEMVAAFPDSSAARDALASFLYGQEKTTEAIEIWQELAEQSDLNQTLHVARTLMTRGEKQAAYELLLSRAEEFADERLYLGQLVTAALTQEEFETAVRWARRRVNLADQPSELFTAIDQAALACDRAEKVQDVAAELSQASPRTIQQTCLLAELYEAAGDSRAADRVLAEASDAEHILALSQQIRLHESRRQWDQAADATRRLLDLPGGRKSVHVRRLVELYERDYKFAEALPWIDVWKQISPGSTLPWITEARLLEYEGRTDDALQAIRKAVQKFEDDADLRARLAQMYVQSDRAADAEQLYWQLYEATDDLSGKLRWAQELAELAESQGKVEQLVAQFDERRRSNRQSIVPLLSLSEIHRVANNFEERRQALTAAAKIKPDDFQLLLQIARIEEAEGHWEQAVATLEKVAARDDSGHARRRIAQLHLTYGDEEKGFALLLEAAAEKDADARAVESVADAMAGMWDWERAADFLAERIVDHPTDYRLRYLYGVALEESGRIEAAVDQFVLLLDDQEELSSQGNQKQTSQAQLQNSYMQAMAQMLPPEAVEWLHLTQYRHMAYGYQQRRNTNAYPISLSRGGSRSQLHYPPSVEFVRPYALNHLITTASLLEEEQLEEVLERLEAAGVADAEVLVKYGGTQNGTYQNLPQVLEEYPDSEAALALFVMRMGQQADGGPLTVRAYEVFRDDYPELAFMAALQAGQAKLATESVVGVSDEGLDDQKETDDAASSQRMFDAALELAASIEKPGPNTVMMTAVLLGGNTGQPSSQGNLALGEADREKFARLLLQWYPHVQLHPNYGRHAFVYVLRALQASGDASAYVNFVADEVARTKAQSGRSSNMHQAMYGRQQNQRLLEPLSSPPTHLADFPLHVLRILHPSGGNDPFGRVVAGTPVSDLEAMLPLLPKLSDPVLRILLAMKLEGEEAEKLIERTLDEMLADESPRLDAYLLAAGRAMERQRLAEGLKLLEKARFLPMERDVRQVVDAAIVAAVLDLRGDRAQTEEGMAATITKYFRRLQAADEASKQDVGQEATTFLQAGRDAALRLRRSRLDSEKRIELATALDSLGLKEEADRLEKATAAIPSGTPAFRSASRHSSPTSPSAMKDRIEKLVASGKRDAAVRLLAGQASSYARQLLSNPQNATYYKQQFAQGMDPMASLKLTDDVFKKLHPGKSRNAQRVAEFAAVCELFDRPEEARAAYERLLAARPRDEQTRIRLIIQLGKDDLSAAREHLEKLSGSSSPQFGQMLWHMMQQHDATIQERLNYGHLASDYLASIADERFAQTSWAATAVSILAQGMHSGQQHLPWLYLRDAGRSDLPQNLEAIQADRIALHRAFCRQMLEMPDLRRSGFTHLLAASEAAGKVAVEVASESSTPLDSAGATPAGDEGAEQSGEAAESTDGPPLTVDGFMQMAGDVLLLEVKEGNRQSPVSFHYSSNRQVVPLRSPEEFLVRVAAATNDWQHLDEQLIPSLQKHEARDAVRRLTRYAALYRAPSEEFLSAAEAVVEHDQPVAGQHVSHGGLMLAIDAWQQRQLNVDLSDLFGKLFRRDASGGRTHQAPPYVFAYLRALAARGDLQTAKDVLETIATQYLGPADRRQQIIKQHYQSNTWSAGSMNGNLHIYGNIIEQLLQDPQIVFAVLQHLQPLGEVVPVNNLEHRTSSAARAIFQQEPAALVASLEGSPWFAACEDFSVLSVGSQVDKWPLTQVINLLRNERRKEERRTQLVDLLSKKESLGARLFIAFLDKDAPDEAVIDELSASLDAIERMPKEEQSALAALLSYVVDDIYAANTSEDPELTAVLRWFKQQTGTRTEQILRQFAEAEKLEDLGVEQHGVDAYLAHLLEELAANESDAAVVVFGRMAELAEEARQRNQYHFYHGGGRSVAGSLLDRVCMQWRREDGNLSLSVLLLDILGSSSDRPIEVGSNVRQFTFHLLRHAFDEASKNGGRGKGEARRSNLERLQELYRTTNALLGDRPAGLFLGGFYDVTYRRLNDAERTQLIEWIEATREADPEAGNLLEILELAARASHYRRAARNASPEVHAELLAGPAATQMVAILSENLRDDRQPFAVRVALLEVLRQHGAVPTAPELREAAIRLYVKAIEGGVPLLSQQHQMFLELASTPGNDADAPELAAAVTDVRDAWIVRFAQQSTPRSTGAEVDEVHDTHTLALALRLFLAADELERVNQIIAKYDKRLGADPQAMIALARGGESKLAAKLFERHRLDMRLESVHELTTRYDAEIHALRDALEAEIESPGDAYFAQLILAALGDPTGDADAAGSTLPSRTDRLKEAAERFGEIDFSKAPGVEARVLDVLATDVTVRQIVADPLAAHFEQTRIAAPAQRNNSPATRQAVRLAGAHIYNQLAKNDATALTETMSELQEQWRGEDHFYGQALPPLIDGIESALKQYGADWTAPTREEVAETLRDMLKDRQHVYLPDPRQYTRTVLVAHALAGQSEEFAEWLAAMPRHSKSRIQHASFDEASWAMGRDVLGPPGDENRASRIAFLKSLLPMFEDLQWVRRRQPWVYGIQHGKLQSLVDALIEKELITEQEASDESSELVAKLDDGSVVLAAMAGWLHSREQYAAAAPLWQRLVDAIDDDAEPWSRTEWNLGLAKALYETGNHESARQALAALNADRLGHGQPELYRELQKQLESEEQEGPADEPTEQQESDTKDAEAPVASAVN